MKSDKDIAFTELLQKTVFDDTELSVYIDDKYISDDEWKKFCLIISQLVDLHKITFNGNMKPFNDARWNELRQALICLPKLKNFTMLNPYAYIIWEHNLVNVLSDSWTAIFDLLSSLPHLQELVLELNSVMFYREFPTEIWDKFYSGLCKMISLKHLTLSGLGHLSEIQRLDLYEFIGELTKLQSLNLRNYQLITTPEDIARFGEALSKTDLKILDLACNELFKFDALQCAALTAALPATLEELDLTANKLDKVWGYLAPGLVKFTNLKKMNLQGNELVWCLKASQLENYKFVEKLPNLQIIDLSLNSLDEMHSQDVESFCKTLSNIPRLHNLKLEDNRLNYFNSSCFFEGLSSIASPIQISGLSDGVEDFYNNGPIKTHLVNNSANAKLHTDYNRIRMLRTYASYIADVRSICIKEGDKRHLDIDVVCKILEFKFKKEEVKKIKAFFGVKVIPAQEKSMFNAFKTNRKIVHKAKKHNISCCYIS